MGQPASMVIIEDGRWSLYYDHWCGNRLDVELMWGPDLALEFIRRREPVARDQWPPEDYLDGGALIDLGKKTLLFFSGDDVALDVRRRRAALDLISRAWPGWTVRWADEGQVSLQRHIGWPLRQAGDLKAEEHALLPGECYVGDLNYLLTWRRDGQGGAAHVVGDFGGIAAGPEAISALMEKLDGALTAWGEDAMPVAGFHADFDARRLAVWSPKAHARLAVRLASAWRGWTVEWLDDRFEDQLGRLGRPLALPIGDPAHWTAKQLAYVRLAMTSEHRNPALAMADDLPEGYRFEAHPITEWFRGSVGDEAAKAAQLEALENAAP